MIPLLGTSREAQKKTQEQAEDERAPKIPVSQARRHVALEQGLSIHHAASQSCELFPRPGNASTADVRIGSSDASLGIEHSATQEVAWVEHFP